LEKLETVVINWVSKDCPLTSFCQMKTSLGTGGTGLWEISSRSKLATEKYYGKVEVPKVVTLRLERQDEEIESIR
jgi:hypothetical protein